MCGIAALFATYERGDLTHLAHEMADLIRHRGPDDEGVVGFEDQSGCWCALAHRRLSIIDLSDLGHQPMASEDGRYTVVYNGEIFNYLELRSELESAGLHFRSHSDTEVLLKSYQEWGPACLHRFNGMFALVIVDRQERRLFAARDRFGVKPLYYWQGPDGLLALASEIKQFTCLPGWRPALNGQRAYDYLNWAVTDHTRETLFGGVFQLRGGEMMEVEIEPKISSWYTLQPTRFDGTLAEAGEQFADLLSDSIRLRLRADVPIGSCLSGGLDSSSIVCLANGHLRACGAEGMQKTFSACTQVAALDERPFMEEVVAYAGVESHYIYPDLPTLWRSGREILWHQDEPYGSTSVYAQWEIFRLVAQQGVKVMLDGQGADEQLAGYDTYFAARFLDLFSSGRWLQLWREMGVARRQRGYPSFKMLMDQLLPLKLVNLLRRRMGRISAEATWLDMERLGATPTTPHRSSRTAGESRVEAMGRRQVLETNLPMLLRWEDRNSMAHSVEARTPFLDYRLVELIAGLPTDYKLSDGVTKRVLREGMRDRIPERVRDRRDKLGFVTPEESWVRGEGREAFRRLLGEAVESSSGLLKGEIIRIGEEMIAGRRPFHFLLWRVINFGQWLDLFSVSL